MKKTLILLLSPIVIFVFLNIIISSNYNLNNEKVNSIYYSNTLQDFRGTLPLDYVNIGSSHGARAFIYPKNTISLNLGMPSQDLEYGLKLLESINERITDQTVIIIPLSYFSFTTKYIHNSSRYSNFLPFNKIYGLTYQDYLHEKYFPLIGLKKLDTFISHGILREYNTSYDSLHRTLDLVEWKKESEITTTGHLKVLNDGFDEYNLNLLINFIKSYENNKIILINTPYHKIYNDTFDLNILKLNIHYYNHIELLKTFSNVSFLDYSKDSRFESYIEFFLDDDHLNYLGAELFTKILLSDLESIDKSWLF